MKTMEGVVNGHVRWFCNTNYCMVPNQHDELLLLIFYKMLKKVGISLKESS